MQTFDVDRDWMRPPEAIIVVLECRLLVLIEIG